MADPIAYATVDGRPVVIVGFVPTGASLIHGDHVNVVFIRDGRLAVGGLGAFSDVTTCSFIAAEVPAEVKRG